jgi:hypothetical protein
MADTPPRTTRAALAGARCPAQLTSFCPAPSKHLGKLVNGSPGREAQRGGAAGPACAQGLPVRCGCAGRPDPQLWCARTHTQAPTHRDACGRLVRTHTHTSTCAQRCLRSAHTQLAQLPYPPAPPPTRPPFPTTQFRTELSTITNLGLVFRSPRTLRENRRTLCKSTGFLTGPSSSRVPWLGSDPLSAWWLGLAPATLEFWVRFPNERNQENRRTLC